MNAEASAADNIQAAGDFSDILISGHAPIDIDGIRLNIGALDDEFQEFSISQIVDYIDKARRLPNLKKVNIHPAPKRWLHDNQTRGREGDYSRLIDAIRRISASAAEHGIEIVLENNNAYWTDISSDIPADQVDWTRRNVCFGASPEEWIQICQDVARPNVGLCLDSSPICTYAHTIADPERRRDVAMAFVSRPELIRHVHWDDNYLYDARGRNDSHACVGKGTLPLELHRVIKELDATLLLEHFYSLEELEEELEFIDGL